MSDEWSQELDPERFAAGLDANLNRLRAENERLREALDKIASGSEGLVFVAEPGRVRAVKASEFARDVLAAASLSETGGEGA